MFKVTSGNTRIRYGICLKLTINAGWVNSLIKGIRLRFSNAGRDSVQYKSKTKNKTKKKLITKTRPVTRTLKFDAVIQYRP